MACRAARWSKLHDPKCRLSTYASAGAFSRPTLEICSEPIFMLGANSSMHSTMNIFILVHGTWARGFSNHLSRKHAQWCTIDAPLRRALADIGPSESVAIETFEWSGSNSVKARLSAAISLQKHLDRVRQRDSSAHIHIIAHSHGGNVAMYALRDAWCQEQIASLVCLSTPFLHVYPRNFRSDSIEKLATAVRMLLTIVFGLISAYLYSTAGNSFLLQLGALVPLLLLPILLRFELPIKQLATASRQFGEKLSLPRKLPFPVLILRDTSDEAMNILGAVQLISTCTSKALGLLISLLPPTTRGASLFPTGLRVAIAPIILIGIFLCGSLLRDFGTDQLSHLLGKALQTIVIFPVLLIALTPFPVLFITLICIMSLPFGGGLFGVALNLHVAVESSPPGTWTVYQLSGEGSGYAEDQGVRHATHSNPAAIRKIVHWMTENVFQPSKENVNCIQPSIPLGFTFGSWHL